VETDEKEKHFSAGHGPGFMGGEFLNRSMTHFYSTYQILVVRLSNSSFKVNIEAHIEAPAEPSYVKAFMDQLSSVPHLLG
jgi:hypothetical protein